MLTARTKTIERTGTGRQFPPSLASLSATKFSLQIYMELTGHDLWFAGLKPLFHSSQKPTNKLAARTFIQSQYLKALAASLRVGFCDEWKRGLKANFHSAENIARSEKKAT